MGFEYSKRYILLHAFTRAPFRLLILDTLYAYMKLPN